MFRIFVTVLTLSTILSSCIVFPVISHVEKASTLPNRVASLSIGEYAREFFVSSRLGIFQSSIFGLDSGASFYYSLPSSDFFSYSVSPDLKISLLQNNQTKFATGIEFSFLSLYSTLIQQTNLQNLYFVLPIYMDSEITDWFTFILNFRFFVPLFYRELGNTKLYNENFITVNTGVNFFKLITLQGYLLASPLSKSIFPVPGIQLMYEINF